MKSDDRHENLDGNKQISKQTNKPGADHWI